MKEQPGFNEDATVPSGNATVDLPRSPHDQPTTAVLGSGTSAGLDAAQTMRIRYFGDYEIIREIARGGMGVVFQARQISLNRLVALKMILSGQLADDADVRRFYIEAEAAANLDHPGIVSIFEVGQREGQHYFSMAFIEGQSLAQRLAGGPLPSREAAELIGRVADAIEYAHQRGVVHRDLKPANILLDPNGNPRVTDFGLAKKVKGDSGLTGSGQIMGTPSYMPPEQAGGKRGDVGPVADVYALGATLYALVTGRPPFQAASVLDTVNQVINDDPVPPRRLNPAVGRDIETICLKCLEKDPGRRYGSAAALSEDLRRFLMGEPIAARPVGPHEHVWRWCRRRPALACSLAAVAILALSLLSGAYASLREIASARNQTRAHLVRLHVSNGSRLLENGDRLGSLAWFAQALLLDDPKDAGRLATHRLRLGALLSRSPRVENVWFDDLPLNHAEFSPDGRLVATGSGEPFGLGGPGTVQVGDVVATGSSASPRVIVHPRAVLDVAFSTNGKVIASASVDGSVRLWDLATGQPDGPALPCAFPVSDVEFSPDGRWLAAGSGDPYRPEARGEVRIWNVATGRLATKPLEADRPCLRVAFSPDSRWLVAAEGRPSADGQPGAARIVAVGSWEVTAELPHHGAVLGVAFSPDGTRVVTASEDGTARVWDRMSGHPALPPWKHGNHVVTAGFSPDGRRVVTASRDGTARIWNTATGVEMTPPLVHAATVKVAQFSADGTKVLTASSDRSARVWDARTGQPLSPPLPHAGKVIAAQFQPGGKGVLTAGFEGMTRLWNIEPQTRGLTLAGHSGKVLMADFDPSGNRIVTTSDDGTARLWDAHTGKPCGAVLSHAGPVLRAAFRPDGRSVLTVSVDGTARIWKVPTGEPLSPPLRHGLPVNDGSFSPDGTRILTACEDGAARLWDSENGQPVGAQMRHEGPVMSVAFHPDGNRVATSGRDQTARVWDRDGQPRFVLRHPAWVDMCRFSANGAYLVTTCWDTSIARRSAGIWDAATGRPVGSPLRHGDGVLTAAFRGDSQRVVTGGEDNIAQVWEVASSRPVGMTLRHNGYVVDAEFSPDGRQLATASRDGRASLWDPETGELLMPPMEHQGPVRSVRFSPDGRWLLTAGEDGVARLWDLAGDNRSLAALSAAAQFLAAHQVDDGGRLMPLELADLRRTWEQSRQEIVNSMSP